MDTLYLNDRCTDIVCFVGENKLDAVRFPAHKCVLTVLSPVFAAMLEGDNFKESVSGEILFTDVTPIALNALLYFAYTGRLKNYAVADLSDILFAAEKYLIDDLITTCLNNLSEIDIHVDNFWSFYHIAHQHYSELMPVDIVRRIRDYLTDNTMVLIQHADFENLSHSEINSIVESDYINPKTEFDLFNVVINWSRLECCRRKLSVNSLNQRQVLGDIVYKFRFFLMSKDELRKGPIKSKILSIEEGDLLLSEHQNHKIDLPPPWINKLLCRTRNRQFQHLFHFHPKSVVRVPSAIHHQLVDDDDDDSDEDSDDEYDDEYNEQDDAGVCHTPIDKRYDSDSDWHSFMLVSPEKILFKGVSVMVKHSRGKIGIICEMRDLQGGVFKEWYFASQDGRFWENSIKIEKSICLNAFKCYEFRLRCTRGTMGATRYETGIVAGEDKYLCVRKSDHGRDREFKSKDYWKKIFGDVTKNYNQSKAKFLDTSCVCTICVEFF